MKRLTVGMVLIVVSIIMLCAAVVIPLVYPPALQWTGLIFCGKDEKITTYQRPDYSENGGVVMGFECVNRAGQTRAVSATLVPIILAAFGIPFTLGLILVITGISSSFRKGLVQQPMVIGNTLPINPQYPTTTAYQLEQLEKLRQIGMISQEDFEKARQSVQSFS